ncbi:ankyrin repeat-containing domain protein [Pyronema domesticum]|nr:ankyrin repeat-containing domain protein [Pyronema domesticum]
MQLLSNTPLIVAAQRGHGAVVSLLLENGASIHQQDRSYTTPLAFATLYGHPEVVNILLNSGANIDALDILEMTPLSLAAQRGHASTVHMLLERGADIHSPDKHRKKTPEGRSLLSVAVQRFGCKSNDKILDFLLKRGANIDAPDQNGCTPLWWAAKEENIAALNHLLAKGANPNHINRYRQTILSQATWFSQEMILSLLDKGAKIDLLALDLDERRFLLFFAIKRGYQKLVHYLLEKDTNIESIDDRSGWTPVTWASVLGKVAIVQSLLLKGANINLRDREGKTPLALVQQGISAGQEFEDGDIDYDDIDYDTSSPRGPSLADMETLLKENGGIL